MNIDEYGGNANRVSGKQSKGLLNQAITVFGTHRNLALAGIFVFFAFGFFALSSLNATEVKAAACNASTTGNWSVGGNWTGCTGAGGVPATGDTITINQGVTITVDSGNPSVAGVTIATGAGANGISISTGQTLTVNGNFAYSANTNTVNQTVTLNGTGNLTVTGTWSMPAPTSSGSSLVTCAASATGTLSVGSTLTMTASNAGGGDVTITGLTCTIDVTGLVTMTGSATAGNTAIINSTTGTLRFRGGLTFAGTAAQTQLTTTGAGTIKFAGTMNNSGTTSINAGTTLEITANATLSKTVTWGNVTITAGTLTLGIAQTVAGNWTNNSASNALTGNFVVTMSGASKTIGGSFLTPFYGLSIGNGASITLNTSCTVGAGNFAYASGATATTFTHASGIDLTVNGTASVTQPTGAVTKNWLINAGTATVTGTTTIGGNTNTASRKAQITITSGTANFAALTFKTGTTDVQVANAVLDVSGGAGTVNISGTITRANLATITPGTTSTIKFTGSAAQTVPMGTASNTFWGACTTQCYANLTILNTNASGATLGNTVSSGNITGNLTIGNGSVAAIFNNGGFAITGTAGDTFEVTNNATFNMTGTSTYPTGFSTFTYGSTSTVNYKQTNAPTVTNPAGSYGHLGLLPAGASAIVLPSGTITIAGNLTIGNGTNAGATATANDPTINLSGNFTIANGATFVATDNNLSIGGNWTLGATGVFTAGAGTVTFTATDAGNTLTGNMTGTSAFYNLTFNGSGGDWYCNSAADLRVTNTLTVTAGTFKGVSSGTYNAYVNNGLVGNGIINTNGLAGNFVIDGSFGGNTDWTFTGALQISTLSGGVTTATGSGNITLDSTFTIASGTFNAGSKIYTLTQSSGTPFNPSAGTFNANTSTFRFTGAGALTIARPANGYYNLESKPAGTVTHTLANGGTFTIANDFVIGTGSHTSTVNASTNNPVIDINRDFIINASATFSASSANMTIARNFTNSGTFTANTGTVTLDTTTTAVVAGSASTETTFRNLTISAGGAKTVQFTSTHKFGVVSGGVFTSTGINGGNVVITSTTGNSQWIMNHQGTESTTYTTVSWSGCETSPASTQIDMTGTGNVNGNNNGTCWYFGAVGITVSGTVYQANESTPDGTGFNLNLSNGGGVAVSTTSNGSGAFSFTGVTTPSSGDVITIWIAGGTYFGTLVFKYGTSCTGNPDCTGLTIVRDQVRIDSKNGGSPTNTQFAGCDNNDGGFGCNSTAIGFDSYDNGKGGYDLAISDGRKLRITDGVTFTVSDGALYTSPSASSSSVDGDLVIGTGSTLAMGANELFVGGDFTNNGTFSESASPHSVTFTATATGHVIDLGTGNFEDTYFTGVGGGWSFSDANNTIAGGLFVNNGTLSGTTNLTVNGGNFRSANAGAINLTNGTVTVGGQGNIGGATTTNLNNLTLSGGSQTSSAAYAGTINIAGDLSVGAGHTLDGTESITVNGVVGGTGIINLSGGTFTHNMVGTQNFGDSGNWTFNNLTFNKNGVSGTANMTGAGTVTVSSVLTVSTGTTLDANSKTFILSGSGTPLVITGTLGLTGGISTFSYRGTSATNVASATYDNVDFSPGSGSPTYTISDVFTINNDFTLAGAGNATVTANNVDVVIDINGDVSIGSGDTFVASNVNDMTVAGSWTNSGTFTHNGAQVFFDGTNTGKTITSGSSAFGLITISGSGGGWTLQDNMTTGALGIVNGDLNASSRTITLTNSGSPFAKIGGTFTQGTSTVNYTGTSATNVLALNGASTTDAYYNLGLGTTSDVSAVTYTSLGSTTVNGTITIGNAGSTGIDYFALGSTTLTLKGSGTPLSPVSGKGGILSETSTIQFTSGSGVAALSSVIVSYNNLIINGTGTFNTGANISTGGDLTVTSGTLAGTHNVEVQGGDVTGNGIINMSGGSIFAAWGTGNFGGDGNWTFNQLEFAEEPGYTQTATGSGSITTAILVLNGTLNAGSKTWTITGTGNSFTNGGGTLNAQNSTFNFTGAGATNIPAYTYNNLGIKPGANSATHTMGTAGSQAFVVGGTLTVGNGSNTGVTVTAASWNPTIDVNGTSTAVDIKANTTFIAPANTFTVAGNWVNAGTFNANSATVTLDASSGSKTITTGGSSFGGLTLGGAATFTPQDTLTVTANLTVNNGTLAGTQNINVAASLSGNGDVNLTGGTLTLTGSGVFNSETNWDFNNISISNGALYYGQGGGSVTIAGQLTTGVSSDFYAGSSKNWIMAGAGTPISIGALAGFNAETSKFTYTSATGITQLASESMTGAKRFYDLEINSAGDTFNAGIDAQVENSLHVGGGTLDFGNNGLVMGVPGSSSTITVDIGQSLLQNGGLTEFKQDGGTHLINGPGTITLGNIDIGIDGNGSAVHLIGATTTLTVKGVLHIRNKSTFNGNQGTLILKDVSETGSPVNNENEFIVSNATVEYASTGTSGTTVIGTSYGNLIVNKAGNTFTPNDNITVEHDLTITAGTFMAPTNLTIGEDFTNNGTFTNNSGTVVFNPNFNNKTSVIGGSSNTTFYNFTTSTPDSAIKFAAGRTYTFTGQFFMSGAQGNPIKLQSTVPDSQWFIDIEGTVSVNYLAVRDSGCNASNDISTAGHRILDQGNNGTCWKFIKLGGIIGSSGGGAGSGGSGGGGGGSGGGGNGNVQATATATIQGGVVNGTEITQGGAGYSVVPLVCFVGGSPSVTATGTANISGGAVISINITLGGTGYQSIPTVSIGAPGTSGGTCGSGGGGGGSGGGGGGAP